MQTRLRFGSVGLAVKIARDLIASEEGKAALEGKIPAWKLAWELNDRLRKEANDVDKMSWAEIKNVIDIAEGCLELASYAMCHPPSCEVLCQHFAELEASRTPVAELAVQ